MKYKKIKSFNPGFYTQTSHKTFYGISVEKYVKKFFSYLKI